VCGANAGEKLDNVFTEQTIEIKDFYGANAGEKLDNVFTEQTYFT
jgi:hypothetical protein